MGGVITDMESFTRQWFDIFRKLILDHSGILIQIDAMNDLGKKIQERMQKLSMTRFTDYHTLVISSQRQDGEMKQLIEMITNNETYFFREPAQFRVLKNHILPKIRQDYPDKKIRIWSAGCSTGEEAYSLAITVLETAMLIGPFSAEVIGTDIDRAAIETAITGIFSRNSFRAIEPYYLNTYFMKTGDSGNDSRQVHDRVKSLIRFEYLNLFQHPYPSCLDQLDIVFFRNVSIYFSKEKIEQINKTISGALRDGGYLFLGSSETLHHNLGNLELTEVDSVYIYRKTQLGTEPPVSPQTDIATLLNEVTAIHDTAGATARSGINGVVRKTTKTPEVHVPTDVEIFSAFKAGDYAKALSWIGELPLVSLESLIIKCHICIAQELFADALQNCQLMMNREPLNPEVYFLYGLTYMYQKQYDIAVDYFRQSIFLKKELSLPHFHLASIYWLQNKTAESKREYRNTVKILEQHKDTSISFALLGYSSDYLINACRQYLSQ